MHSVTHKKKFLGGGLTPYPQQLIYIYKYIYSVHKIFGGGLDPLTPPLCAPLHAYVLYTVNVTSIILSRSRCCLADSCGLKLFLNRIKKTSPIDICGKNINTDDFSSISLRTAKGVDTI